MQMYAGFIKISALQPTTIKQTVTVSERAFYAELLSVVWINNDECGIKQLVTSPSFQIFTCSCILLCNRCAINVKNKVAIITNVMDTRHTIYVRTYSKHYLLTFGKIPHYWFLSSNWQKGFYSSVNIHVRLCMVQPVYEHMRHKKIILCYSGWKKCTCMC